MASALHESFTEAVNKTIDEFEDGLMQDNTFDKEKLKPGMAIIKKKMLASVSANIDRLETFYIQNTHIYKEGSNYDLIDKIENRAKNDENYQERVDHIFKEIKTSCDEFTEKRQQYLKYCLYDKYLDKERQFVDSEHCEDKEREMGYFSIKMQEDKLFEKAKKEKSFL